MNKLRKSLLIKQENNDLLNQKQLDDDEIYQLELEKQQKRKEKTELFKTKVFHVQYKDNIKM